MINSNNMMKKKNSLYKIKSTANGKEEMVWKCELILSKNFKDVNEDDYDVYVFSEC